MPDIVNVQYHQTGQSTHTNPFGMRDMQPKAYEARFADYLLLKAPPASGKSRALMFLALDKLKNQHIKKVIVAVPERSIGSSFAKTDLKSHGFYSNWEPGGFVLFYKRLEKGTFHLPKPSADHSKNQVLDYSQLVMIINGISLEKTKKHSRFYQQKTVEN